MTDSARPGIPDLAIYVKVQQIDVASAVSGNIFDHQSLIITARTRPVDLVFQSVRDGKPMCDNNVLARHMKTAGRKVGLDFVNWRCPRTSYGTWLTHHAADTKEIQAQLRDSRISTTKDTYVQDIPESRRHAVNRLPKPKRMQ